MLRAVSFLASAVLLGTPAHAQHGAEEIEGIFGLVTTEPSPAASAAAPVPRLVGLVGEDGRATALVTRRHDGEFTLPRGR